MIVDEATERGADRGAQTPGPERLSQMLTSRLDQAALIGVALDDADRTAMGSDRRRPEARPQQVQKGRA